MSMRKCLACGEQFNGNVAIGHHYKDNPTHSPKYKPKKEKQITVVPASIQTMVHRIIQDPTILTNEIDGLLKQNAKDMLLCEERIEQLQAEKIRLENLKSTLRENGINLIKESA